MKYSISLTTMLLLSFSMAFSSETIPDSDSSDTPDYKHTGERGFENLDELDPLTCNDGESSCYSDQNDSPVFKTRQSKAPGGDEDGPWYPYKVPTEVKTYAGGGGGGDDEGGTWTPYKVPTEVKTYANGGGGGDDEGGTWIPYKVPTKLKESHQNLINATVAMKGIVSSDKQLSHELEKGDWKESTSLTDSLKNGAILGTAAVLLYKLYKLANIPIAALSFAGSAGAYADYDSEILDHPERIFNLSEEEVSLVMENPEISKNTLKMVEHTYGRNCLSARYGNTNGDVNSFCQQATTLFTN